MSKPGEAVNVESWILKEWALRLKQALESMTGEPAQVQAAAEAPPPEEGASWWRQPFSLGRNCQVWAGAPAASRDEIGGRVLASAGIDDASPEDRAGTYHEILNQALAGLAHGLTGLAGKEVTASDGAESPAPTEPISVLQVSFGGAAPLPLYFAWDPAIAASLQPKKAAAAAPAPASPAKQEEKPPSAEAPSDGPSKALDLLYDVELPLSVSFGRAHLPLKEVLKLTSGSIVELNRMVTEPVEVIVNNCVIARGEVVVVEGNYGVRIQQIVSRNERLRTLQ